MGWGVVEWSGGVGLFFAEPFLAVVNEFFHQTLQFRGHLITMIKLKKKAMSFFITFRCSFHCI